ncbi:isochorismatase family protein [Streptomyces sp. NPDC041068]|uniref:isochorismatase family protein n=1 Tax=Streptomyces sp. NPDC041068 TaxID=3155130 RepID=UPI0033C73949
MPGPSAIPPSRAAWKIDPARAALLVQDMQNHFVGAFPAGLSPVAELIENVVALRELAGTLGMPVIFSAEPAGQSPGQRGLMADLWGPGIGVEPSAAAIVADLTPRPGEHLLDNVRPNAFLRSHLGRLLRSAGRDQLIVCGVYAHFGVLLTAMDAFMHDIQAFVVADAIADFSAEDHFMALRWAARSGVVRSTDRMLHDLLVGRATQGAQQA